ncbi:Putative phosphoesterase [Halomicronema hongdechloris C2206]|uniref:Phosphoesterase n=1 Tax=Halomicronema hongdechloris C2206 TaxID=1641165 RepID=A0A1Z3HGA3_9CYAN|nr:2'-5' RNA ligase family protein [Halomicronema hongdechloris]ASC69308.1 Putative phosphoesterase [Halomicronema hongdechloris C2206]
MEHQPPIQNSPQPDDTPRWFIALLPPLPLQEQITAIKQEICDRYQSRAALRSPPHITLQPPFRWPLNRYESLLEHLSAIAQEHAPIPIQLSGFGAFPPRVIFIHVAKTPALMASQPAVMQALAERLGISDEKSKRRAFTPHLTVGFRDLTPKAFRQAWPEFRQRSFQAEFVASHLTLLRHDGQRWQIDGNVPFAGVLSPSHGQNTSNSEEN